MSAARIGLLAMTLRQGGIARVLVNLGNRFAELGLVVDVLVVEDTGVYASQFSEEINIQRLPTSNRLTAMPAMVRYLRKHRPDAVLCANPRLTQLALFAAKVAASKVRVYSSLHTTYSVDMSHGPKRERKIARLRKYHPRCAGIFAVSRGVAEDFIQLTGLASELVQDLPSPVVTPALHALGGQPVAHEWLQHRKLPVVLAVGRMRPQKNYPLLLEAFAALQRRKPSRLIILGDGPLRPEIEARIAELGLTDNVSLEGQVSNPYAYMKQSDLFVLSSDFEGLGNVLIEALALGVPVVSTDCPHGPREILQGGRYGALVPTGDAEALADAMFDALESPQSPPPDVVERYSVQASADAYLRAMHLPVEPLRPTERNH